MILQGCRCDGYAEQQTRLEGIVPGGLAAGGLSQCTSHCCVSHQMLSEASLLLPLQGAVSLLRLAVLLQLASTLPRHAACRWPSTLRPRIAQESPWCPQQT